MSEQRIVEIWIPLLEEGSPAIRGTEAVHLGNGRYKILAASDYDPKDEVWEFPPGSIVKGEIRKNQDEMLFIAVEKIN